jgi:alkane 1-monooxygenase
LGHGIWTFSSVLILFGVLPLLELFFKGSTQNLSEIEEELVKKDWKYDALLYSLVPVQYGTLWFFLNQMSVESMDLITRTGMITAMGMSCGVLGINAAHELGHRHTWYEQWMSRVLLLSTLYMHFFIEHNRGHHKNVSTDEDPASARYGEWIYTFYFRTIAGSWLSAWKIEADNIKKKGVSFWSHQNEMLRFQIIQLIFLGIIYFVWGIWPLLSFLAASFIGILLLETVNYIEHYGLRRKKINGRYERTLPVHSWNSNHPIGRLLLLELSRHSDHHYMANRKYQTLRHFDNSPQMPTGYPGMMILSLFPPLWFRVMHKKIDTIAISGLAIDQKI